MCVCVCRCDSSSTDGLDGSTTGATATGAVSTSDENEYYVSQMKLMQFGTLLVTRCCLPLLQSCRLSTATVQLSRFAVLTLYVTS